jgi:hypothetical protein
MKKILSILILILPLVTFSQNNEQPSIIFEGVAVAAIEFFIDDMGKADTNTTGEHGLKSAYTTNTSYLVKVTRVLKGHEYLDTGYIEVITKLSYNHLNNRGKYENYIPNLYPGIFFMELNTVPVTLERKTNNNNVLQPFNFKPMKIDFNRYDCFAVDYEKDKCFKTKIDLSTYLFETYDINYLNENNLDINDENINNDIIDIKKPQPKKKSVFLNNGSVKPKQNSSYQENLINYNQFIFNSKIKQEKQSNFTTKSNHTLELELDNVTMTDDANFRYYEFDILASDVDGGYFDNLLIRLAYNTNAFGSNLVANENITITKGSSFNSDTYINPNTNVIDENSGTLGIPFGTDFNAPSLNRTKLSMSPKIILHVKITIQQCNFPVNIEFSDISFTPMFSFYTTSSNDELTDVYSYDSTDYGISITDKLCKPIITSFTPSVATGIGDIITIKGKYFGNDRLNNGINVAQIRFRNADKTNLEFMNYLDPVDYIHWSDTEIEVSATSLIESENNAGIGTGNFIVKNKWGDNTTSDTELFVEYAIQNHGLDYGDEYLKKRGNLIYDTTGYVFAFNSNILNDPVKKAVTEKAIRDLACQTGVNFKILYDDLSQISNSTISFGNLVTNSTDNLAYTDPLISVTCYQDEKTRHEIFVTGFEIEMNSNTPWDYDTLGNISTSKYSYYSVLIHELGHAHQLEHVLNAEYELMRPTIALGQSRTFSPNLFAGTDDVINFNSTYNYVNCDYSPMVFEYPDCTTNSITENHIDENVFVYPNPFTQQITIDLNSIYTKDTDVEIFNILGEVVYYSSHNNPNQEIIVIDLKNLSKGIYLLKIKTGDKIIEKKIIKPE